jgi:hypothetical protein
MSIEQRLERLERSVRTWKLAGCGLALVVLCGAAQTVSENITTKSLATGSIAATSLALFEPGPDGIAVVDKDKMRAKFAIGEDGLVQINLMDGSQRVRFTVGVDKAGTGTHCFFVDPNQGTVLMLFEEQGAGHVAVHDAQGKTVGQLP